jgi:hypothetical protein
MFNFFVNKKTKSIWNEFEGKINTDKVIIEKAKKLAKTFIAFSSGGVTSIFEEMNKSSNHNLENKWDDVFIETIIFNMIFTKRISEKYLKDRVRDLFNQTLLSEINNILIQAFKTTKEREACSENFIQMYNQCENEYSLYKITPPLKTESMSGYLLWEFGKKVSNILDCKNDSQVIVLVNIAITGILTSLKIPDLLNEM